ncbi:uracil-DNA glycosylase family protein [Pandoraea sp.]|uniref:uracil-DNA glycosylase family protein n=1 Tax=Pandoraea sp. TaxID=1883445 RepID=UPI001219FA8B|nr:uracil-DNA glycosylase family protein [Pandoraea sp.]TAL53837.1 MAG: hypothetical protein EPN80_14325 [Pandoraea sp.]TAM17090.1 MAG: hypothetical protein EPN65_12495 [Pandoraea sp.]
MNVTAFYGSICDCSCTSHDCPGTFKSPSTGSPPRGFYTKAKPGFVDLLAVCKNPGHTLPDEKQLYRGLNGFEIASAHMEYAEETFRREHDINAQARRSTRFHKNLVRYLSYFLDVPEENVFERAVYTNLVKCSTPDERARLDPRAMSKCFESHFARELDFFKPRVLLACGREVERFLNSEKTRCVHRLPVIYVKHPSYYYRRENEQPILEKIRADVQQHLRST